MIKQVKSVKVYWNDPEGSRPSFYPNMRSALSSIKRVLASGGSAAAISVRETTRLVNTDNAQDMAWYERHAGKTCAGAKAKRCHVRPKDRVPAGFVQPELPIASGKTAHPKKGDAGFEDRANPARKAAGAVGGLACAGRSKARTHRRPRGTVRVKDMSVKQRREYWRWTDARKRARKAGVVPPAWDTWVLCSRRKGA